MKRARHYLPFAHMFSSAIIDQGLLSAGSFVVSVILIRHTSDLQYGYYVLAVGGILLLSSLQNAFIGPPMVNRMVPLEDAARGRLIGGLYREQNRLVLGIAAAGILGVAAAWASGGIDWQLALLIFAALVTAPMTMERSFFRMSLFACRRAHSVLRGDTAYTVVLLAGVALAILGPEPAAMVVLVMGVASWLGSRHLRRTLRQGESFDTAGAHGILLKIAPLGLWSAGGAVIYWTFSQGYNYLVAGTLDVTAIAAIASTRLLLMPVNLLSSGIGALMLPLTSNWMQYHSAAMVMRRLALFALLMAGAALCYFVLLWFTRDWIFIVVLKKHFTQRDPLLLLWSATFLVMAMRDQLIFLLVVRERFRRLAALSLASALIALAVSYWGMLRYSGVGAPLGVLVGECINFVGIIILSLHEIGDTTHATGKAANLTR